MKSNEGPAGPHFFEYFDTPFEDPVPLEPLVVVEGGSAGIFRYAANLSYVPRTSGGQDVPPRSLDMGRRRTLESFPEG